MVRRFVDASVFVHAYLRPRRPLKPHERTIKRHAKAIVARIARGESVVTSAVHFSEVANLLEGWIALADAQAIERGLVGRDNVEVLPVARSDLLEGLSAAMDLGVGTTDALAAVLMERNGLSEVYSFDRDFDRVPGLKRISR
ncbi:MAG: type II toxin-antitoxin system VapC family toxin [Euryarchaeota archaeon]|nr:type II toxin-antitoxin system VapC family toxin [Euryarchaeota archaeon]